MAGGFNAEERWNKNRAIVYIAGVFTYGIVSLVRAVYSDGKPDPLVKLDFRTPQKPEIE